MVKQIDLVFGTNVTMEDS